MAELFDVLDEQGKKTGKVMPRDEVHAQELWHGIVHIWIVNFDNDILLQFRGSEKKVSPNCWDTSVAGHITAGETQREAATRELAEEIGVMVAEEELKELGKLSELLPFLTGGTHREHEWIFLLRKDLNIHALKLKQDELKEVKWFTSDELEALLHSSNRAQELSKHEDKLFQLAIDAARGESGK